MKPLISYHLCGFTTWCLVVATAILSAREVYAQGAPDILWTTNAYGPDSYIVVAFSPDSAILGTAGRPVQSDQPREIKLWRAADGSFLRTIRLPKLGDGASSLSFWPDGSSLVGAGSTPYGDGESAAKVWHWRVSDGALLQAWQYAGVQNARCVSLSSDRDWLAVAGVNDLRGQLVILKSADFIPVAYILRDLGPYNWTETIAFSPAAKLLVSGHHDGTVKLWSYTNGFSDDSLLQSFPGHSSRVRKVAFLPGGDLVLSVADGGQVLVRRVQDGEVILRFGEGGAEDSAVAPDGRILLTKAYSGSLPPPLRFWRVADGALLKLYDVETERARSVALSSDNRFFAYSQGIGRIVLARMPALITDIQTAGSQMLLRWQGGSGRYQLQRSARFSGNTWLNVGEPTTNTSASLSITNTNWFFRVQSLPNPL